MAVSTPLAPHKAFDGEMLSGEGQSNSYTDVTAQVDLNGSDMVGWNSRYGGVKTLFDPSEPSGKEGDGKSKQRSEGSASDCDWVESIGDPRLILSIPFWSPLDIQALHITSFPPMSPDDSGSETAMRPGTIQIFATKSGILSFEDAEDTKPTQSIDLTPHWGKKTGTAEIKLDSVKFQNVSSLVVYVVDGDGSGTHVRMDRLRVFGRIMTRVMDIADLSDYSGLNNRSYDLITRYKRPANLKDLEEAVRSGKEAVRTSGNDHPHQATHLNNLGMALISRYRATGNLDDLEEAICSMQQAVKNSSYNICGKSDYFSNLGNVLHTKYEKTRNFKDLEEAVRNVQEAVRTSGDDHPHRATHLNNLAVALLSKYGMTRNVEDIEGAICSMRQAVKKSSTYDPGHAILTSNLSDALSSKYDGIGNLEDLEEAIRNSKEAVKATQHDHHHRVSQLCQLSSLLKLSSEKTGNLEVLEDAYNYLQEAIKVIVHNDPSVTPIYIAKLQLCDDKACKFSERGEHLNVEKALVPLNQSHAVAISYTWGEFKRTKRFIGHTISGLEVSMELGLEWDRLEVISALANICAQNGREHGPDHASCWIDQLCIPQKKDEIRRLLTIIPSIYRTLHTVVLMPGSRCKCLEERASANPVKEIATMCLNSIGLCSYFGRVWTRQELNYSKHVRLVRTSEKPLPCVTSLEDVHHLSIYSQLLAHKYIDVPRAIFPMVSIANSVFFLELEQSFIEKRQAQVNAKLLDFLLGREIEWPAGGTSLSDQTELFLVRLCRLGYSKLSATEACDYVTSIWVDCPGYTLPEEYKKMPLPDLLDDAIRQFETNHKMSIMATAISALFEDHSSEPALLWRPKGQLGDRKITSVSDLYATIVHNRGLIPIDVVGHPQYTLTQQSVPLSKSALDYTERFNGKSEKEVFEVLRPVFENIAPMSKEKATIHILPELEQAVVGDKFAVIRKNQMLPLQWMRGNTSNTDLPADHHKAVYKLVASVLGLDVGACKTRKLSLMVSLDPGHPCIGLRKQVPKCETKNARTHITISATPNGWEDGGRRYHFLLEGYKEDDEDKEYHITGIWVPHCWDEGPQSGAAISG